MADTKPTMQALKIERRACPAPSAEWSNGWSCDTPSTSSRNPPVSFSSESYPDTSLAFPGASAPSRHGRPKLERKRNVAIPRLGAVNGIGHRSHRDHRGRSAQAIGPAGPMSPMPCANVGADPEPRAPRFIRGTHEQFFGTLEQASGCPVSYLHIESSRVSVVGQSGRPRHTTRWGPWWARVLSAPAAPAPL